MPEDEKILKAMVSETRRDIIKTLSNGDRTPSDLSKILDKSKSTVVEHLNKLIGAGLVEKDEKDGRKWVFYGLTRQGESLVSKRPKKLVIMLSTIFLAVIGGVISLIKYSSSNLHKMANEKDVFRITEGAAADAMNSVNIPWLLYLSIALFSLALLGILALILMKRKKVVEI